MEELRRELRGEPGVELSSSVCVPAVRLIDGKFTSPTKEVSDGEEIGEASGDASSKGDAKGRSASSVWVEVCCEMNGGEFSRSKELPDGK